MAQPNTSVRQKEAVSSINSRKNESTKSTNPAGFSPKVQQSAYRPLNPGHSQQFRQRPPPLPSPNRPSAHAPHPQNSAWNFTSSFGPERSPLKEITSSSQSKTVQTKVQVWEYVENILYPEKQGKIVSNYQPLDVCSAGSKNGHSWELAEDSDCSYKWHETLESV